MPNFISLTVRCFVRAIVPSKRSQKPETIRQTTAIDVCPYIESPMPSTALMTPIYVRITV